MTFREAIEYFAGLQQSFVMNHCCGNKEFKASEKEYQEAIAAIMAELKTESLAAFLKETRKAKGFL